MNPVRRPKLSIEQLEHRDCPSFVLRLTGGNLIVTGAPTSQAGKAVRFTQVANNRWQVLDGGGGAVAPAGGVNLGTYSAANITLQLAQHTGAPVIFDLGGPAFTSSGNVLIDLGTG